MKAVGKISNEYRVSWDSKQATISCVPGLHGSYLLPTFPELSLLHGEHRPKYFKTGALLNLEEQT